MVLAAGSEDELGEVVLAAVSELEIVLATVSGTELEVVPATKAANEAVSELERVAAAVDGVVVSAQADLGV